MENVIDIRNRIFEGDALIEQKKIPSNHVDMCFTSPPYWALRDYGITGQLGIEKDFNEYIEKLCNIFEETKRVLKKEGTLWVNINDTYNSHSANSKNVGGFEGRQMRNNEAYSKTKLTMKKVGVPDKSMFMIPERFAQEMINRGWILRNKIIWQKPNPMPSSALDRFTQDYEYIYLFARSKKYYFKTQYEPTVNGKNKRLMRAVWNIATKPSRETNFAMFPPKLAETIIKSGCPEKGLILDMFFGGGTTGVVAKKLGRYFVGIEINNKFIEIAKNRLSTQIKNNQK